MKNFIPALIFFFLVIPSGYSQNGLRKAPSAGQTSIRSVVAQGAELRMLLHVAEAGAYQLNIYSMDGEIVYQETLQVASGEVEQRIPFTARTHGVYEVNVSGAGGQTSRQVMW
ncbi:MAG TPA: hypothetical protein VL978_17065 [Puia sp.]|nr:hypothetical protein [Puia sp.]